MFWVSNYLFVASLWFPDVQEHQGALFFGLVLLVLLAANLSDTRGTLKFTINVQYILQMLVAIVI